jgi:hypothetical protein
VQGIGRVLDLWAFDSGGDWWAFELEGFISGGDWWVFDSGLRTEQIEEKEAI